VIFYRNIPNLHNRYKSAERKISQKNPEYMLNWMHWNHTWQTCPLQGPYQVLLLFIPTVLRSRWLLLLKIEILTAATWQEVV
jgi:hypothetical protein